MQKTMLHWKVEPISPLSSEEVLLEDDDSFYQSSYDEIKFENDDFEDCESKAQVASQILENLEKLVDLDELIKPDSVYLISESSFLLDDDKILPLLEDVVEPPRAIPVQLKHDFYQQPFNNNNNNNTNSSSSSSTNYLVNEFEKVYYELNNNGTLITPPQSPPSSESTIITNLEPILLNNNNNENYSSAVDLLPDKHALSLAYSSEIGNYPSSSQSADLALELAVVDELIRNRVEDIHQWTSSNNHLQPSSPESHFSGDSSSLSDDNDWIPSSENLDEANDEEIHNKSKKSITKKRVKPYSRSHDDRKSRKKEQNKNAATRYRMKKKAEVEEILVEEKQLLEIHETLDIQVTDLQREIKYLKGLMRDLFKAKKLIN